MAIKVDEDKCANCHICEMACSLVNYGESNTKKSAIRSVENRRKIGTSKVIYCTQCGLCADKCPTGAIKKYGKSWIIEEEICIGCGLCRDVCPRGAIFVFPDSDRPIKCSGCGECAKVCPAKAINII